MSDLVILRHPSLPPEQVIQVDRRRIGPRLAAGWEESPAEPKATVEATAPMEPEKPAEPPKRRSRNNTEEQ